jgi:hypothetical protein
VKQELQVHKVRRGHLVELLVQLVYQVKMDLTVRLVRLVFKGQLVQQVLKVLLVKTVQMVLLVFKAL